MEWRLKRLLALLVFVLFSFSRAATALGDMVSEAKKEGKLYWYTSMSVGDHSKFVALFNKKYPFIEVKARRASGTRLISLIQTEHRAGKHLFDVTVGSRFAPSFIRSGVFAKYVSAEYKYFPEGTKDPEGYWADVYVNGIGLSYNTDMVPAGEVPKTWKELLDPKWKGKIAVDPRSAIWYDAVKRVMGKEKGMDFLKKLGDQELLFREGYTLKANNLVAGEYPLCICYIHQIDRVKKQGAPVDWIKSTDLFIVNALHPILISARAQHPNAARLFVDFALSKEGQLLMVKLGRIGSSRPDIDADVPKEVRFIPEDLGVYDRQEEIYKEFNEVLKVH